MITLVVTRAVAELRPAPTGVYGSRVDCPGQGWRVVDAGKGLILAYCDTEREANSIASSFNAIVQAYKDGR